LPSAGVLSGLPVLGLQLGLPFHRPSASSCQVLVARVATLAGELLPSELELAAQFGVSRMTARQAVKSLQPEGLVYRVPGSGTFSSGYEKHRAMSELRSFTSEMLGKGRSVRSQVIHADWINPDSATTAEPGPIGQETEPDTAVLSHPADTVAGHRQASRPRSTASPTECLPVRESL